MRKPDIKKLEKCIEMYELILIKLDKVYENTDMEETMPNGQKVYQIIDYYQTEARHQVQSMKATAKVLKEECHDDH